MCVLLALNHLTSFGTSPPTGQQLRFDIGFTTYGPGIHPAFTSLKILCLAMSIFASTGLNFLLSIESLGPE